jgi:Methionine aminopeptidase
VSVQQYSFEDFKKLKKAGEITAQALDFLEDKIKPGITTDYIDKIASEFLRSKKCHIRSTLLQRFSKIDMYFG